MIASKRKTYNIYDGCLNYLKEELTDNLPSDQRWTTGNIKDLVGNNQHVDVHNYPYDTPNPFIEIFFGTKYIFPSSYSLMGRRYKEYNNAYLKSWEFYGRNKENNWIKLHSEENKTFSFAEERNYRIKAKESFNAFKILMTDKDTSGCYAICLGQIEVFGDIYPTHYFFTPKNCFKTQRSLFLSLSFQQMIFLSLW